LSASISIVWERGCP